MTDYLERMIQGGGETLARALRRVEAALEAAALAAGEADREEKRESARAALDREPETDAGRRRDPANVRRDIGGGPYRNEERREGPPALLEQLKALADTTVVNAAEEAVKLGNSRVMNIILLGMIIKAMGLEEIDWEKIIRENMKPQLVEINLKALALGRSLA